MSQPPAAVPPAPATPPAQATAPTSDVEHTVKTFHESKARFGFWWRAVLSLSIWYWTVYRQNKIELTTRRVIQSRGNWVTSNETSVLLTNITDVTLNRSFLGRIFNYGDVLISSAGSSGSEINATGLADAEKLRSAVFDLRDGRLDESKL